MPRGRKKKEEVKNVNDILGYAEEESEEYLEDSNKKENGFDKNICSDDDDVEKSNREVKNAFADFLIDTVGIDENVDNTTVIPSGIDTLDTILGGGLGMKISMFVGLPGCGKTALAARLISSGQRLFGDKFISAYLDSEESINEARLKDLGCNESTILHSDLTVEKVFRIIEGLCAFKKNNPSYLSTPSIVVWDSVATTSPEGADEAENPAKIMGLKAALLSFYLPKYSRKLSKYNISLLTVNHYRDKIDIGPVKSANDMRGTGNYNIPGGKQLKYLAFHALELKADSASKDIDEYGFNGAVVNVKAFKNKLFTPFVPTKIVLSYQYGFTNFWTNYKFLKDLKRIDGGGKSYCINGYNERKFSQAKALSIYQTDPKFKQIFDEEVKNALQKEYIDVYKNMKTNREDIIGW